MYYKIADIHGNPEYNLKGITLINGKKSVFWSNKNAKTIGEVVVIFNNKQAIPINNNQICISLNGIEDIQTQKEMLKAFCEQLKVMGIDPRTIRFKFIVADKKVKEQADELISSLGINGSVLNFGDVNKNVDEENIDKDKAAKVEKKIEDKFNNNREITGSNAGITNVTKYDDGVRKDIVVAENKAFDISNSSLSMAELMKAKYEELMKDPVMSEKLFNMSDEDAIKYVSDMVLSGNKEYYMEKNDSNINRNNMSNSELATLNVANKYGGVSNNELGITSNDSRYTENKISAVETNGDDNVNVVNPESSSVGMNSSNSSSVSSDIDMNSDVSFQEVDEEEREESNMKLQDTTTFHPTNRNVYGVKKEKTKKRVLSKPHGVNSGYGNAAFISLPVIIFIISLLLLIGSGIIWFMIK